MTERKIDRKRVFQVIERSQEGDVQSLYYDILMLLSITASIVPLTFNKTYPVFEIIEKVTVCIFIFDYLLRWGTADFKLGKGGWSFLIYPFTPMAIIDLMSILPGLDLVGEGFKVLRISRLFKVLRLFKFLRYSDKFEVLWHVLKRERNVLLTVLGLCVFYIFVTALVMFNAEPHINPITGKATFDSFFDALYWATVTLTTVGYGDLTPVTDIGRFVSMLSSLFGVAIIALPSGIITASYLDEIRRRRLLDEMKKNKPAAEEEKTPKEI